MLEGVRTNDCLVGISGTERHQDTLPADDPTIRHHIRRGESFPTQRLSDFLSGTYSRAIRRSGITSEFALPPTATDATPRNPVPAPDVRSSDASTGGPSSIAAARPPPPFEKFTWHR
jgi:hypothetical protein